MGILSAIAAAVVGVAARADHPDSEHDADGGESPIAIDEHGWCSGERLSIMKSARTNSLLTTLQHGPVGVTWHWTATGLGSAWNIAKAWRTKPSGDDHVGSAHFIVGRSGFVVQMVSCLRGSWHAGYGARFRQRDGRWEVAPPAVGSKVSANRLFIGVELECVGEVRQVGGKWMGWPFGHDGDRGPVVPADQVGTAVDHEGRRRHYHVFTDEQVAAARRLLRALSVEYPITRWGASWGHVDIDPQRKSDPGPLWGCHAMAGGHLKRILDAVYGPES